ncbi:MAG: pilus assembly protein TadG-related protein [Alphaproteobacteria bacterium]|nr:pilus assembly protein TadG-related protein [Alphaproteobacteria bacterium]
MFGLIKKLFKKKEGSVMPFVALTFPVVLGMVGLGVDASYWMAQRIDLQKAADAAVISAGWEMAQSTEIYMEDSALREAIRNGYDVSANGNLTLTELGTTTDGTIISLILAQDATTYFSRAIMSNPVRIQVEAQALVTDVDGLFCVLALEQFDTATIDTFGSVNFSMPDCGIAVNSIHDEALTISGNASVVVDNVRISGGYSIDGGSANFQYGSLKTDQSRLEDPYEDLEVPAYSGCDQTNYSTAADTVFSPGVYCGGITVTGNNNITFAPGVYIIDGGSLNISGGGSLFGEGVTFILTGSGTDYAQVDITGNKSVLLSAPLAGEEWEGITFFQDRNAPVGDNTSNKISGTSDLVINGVAYFPSQAIQFSGDASLAGAASPCTKLIARAVSFGGNPSMGNNCDPYGVREIEIPKVRLIN